MKKRNTIAKDLYTPKYAPRVVKAKKGKEEGGDQAASGAAAENRGHPKAEGGGGLEGGISE